MDVDVVTGAFGYTGRYLTARLQAGGRRVRTLTNKPGAGDGDGGVEVHALRFDDPAVLVDALRGARTLYNTYWVRFPHGETSYEQAVINTKTLFRAAADAGVERIVHVSITSANEASPFPYFRGKGALERALRELGVGYAIVRPTVVFGREDILINNIAWLLRRLPVFVLPGGGGYRLQPVYVEDLAALMAEAGARGGNEELDAVGPEVYRFEELVRVVRRAVRSRARLVPAPPEVALNLGRLVGFATRDVLLTRDELEGLRADLLVSYDPPTAPTSFRAWAEEHGNELGRTYSSELARHYRR